MPNQPHLLNKYKINMGISHFHEFGILSGMHILAPYQIDIACERMWFLQRQYYINFLLIFFPTNHDFVRWEQHLFDI